VFSALPITPLLAFHVVFGKSVPDISLTAVANLGYADGKFLKDVYPGDTLAAISNVIGVKENSNGKTGIVWVRTRGENQKGETALSYVRWVMVNKKDPANPAPEALVPDLPEAVPASALAAPVYDDWDDALAGSKWRYGDYTVGEKIDHVDGMTVEESDHMLATRLYQNTAKVHFNQHSEEQGRFGRRLIYGGHGISLARALSFNGCQNLFHLAAINAGRHVAPLFAGETVYAWSEVLDRAEIEGRSDIGALRMRLVATKNEGCGEFPHSGAEAHGTGVILDFDAWFVAPRRA